MTVVKLAIFLHRPVVPPASSHIVFFGLSRQHSEVVLHFTHSILSALRHQSTICQLLCVHRNKPGAITTKLDPSRGLLCCGKTTVKQVFACGRKHETNGLSGDNSIMRQIYQHALLTIANPFCFETKIRKLSFIVQKPKQGAVGNIV